MASENTRTKEGNASSLDGFECFLCYPNVMLSSSEITIAAHRGLYKLVENLQNATESLTKGTVCSRETQNVGWKAPRCVLDTVREV